MRVSGFTSTCPMSPPRITARDESSVSSHSPTRIAPLAASGELPTTRRRATRVTAQSPRRSSVPRRPSSTTARIAAAASGTRTQGSHPLSLSPFPGRFPAILVSIPGHRSRGGAMLFGSRAARSSSSRNSGGVSRSVMTPASPVASGAPEQLRLRGPHGDPRQLGDFGVPISLDIVQHEDLARPGRQRRDGPLEIEREPRVRLPRAPRPLQRARVLGREHPLRPAARRAAAHEYDVDRQAVQPRSERALAAKAPEPLPRPHEGILRELLGLARVGGESQAQRVHAPHVLAVERLERGVVALLRLPDEVGHTWSLRSANQRSLMRVMDTDPFDSSRRRRHAYMIPAEPSWLRFCLDWRDVTWDGFG